MDDELLDFIYKAGKSRLGKEFLGIFKDREFQALKPDDKTKRLEKFFKEKRFAVNGAQCKKIIAAEKHFIDDLGLPPEACY